MIYMMVFAYKIPAFAGMTDQTELQERDAEKITTSWT
jgi:hypothetical protein